MCTHLLQLGESQPTHASSSCCSFFLRPLATSSFATATFST